MEARLQEPVPPVINLAWNLMLQGMARYTTPLLTCGCREDCRSGLHEAGMVLIRALRGA
jgi:hypothetical protein